MLCTVTLIILLRCSSLTIPHASGEHSSTQLDLTVQLHATALLPYGQHAIVQQEIRLREERWLLWLLTRHAARFFFFFSRARAPRLD